MPNYLLLVLATECFRLISCVYPACRVPLSPVKDAWTKRLKWGAVAESRNYLRDYGLWQTVSLLVRGPNGRGKWYTTSPIWERTKPNSWCPAWFLSDPDLSCIYNCLLQVQTSYSFHYTYWNVYKFQIFLQRSQKSNSSASPVEWGVKDIPSITIFPLLGQTRLCHKTL